MDHNCAERESDNTGAENKDQRGSKMSDLCPEDKNKVKKLLHQVAELTERLATQVQHCPHNNHLSLFLSLFLSLSVCLFPVKDSSMLVGIGKQLSPSIPPFSLFRKKSTARCSPPLRAATVRWPSLMPG